MKLYEIVRVDEDTMQMFEMANMPSSKTGVKGTIYISTKNQGGTEARHSARIKWFPGKPGDMVPCLIIYKDGEVKTKNYRLSDEDANEGARLAVPWYEKNFEALQDFWDNGTTWMDDEVDTFKKNLKKV